MKSYSQSGQDLFVNAVMGDGYRGNFLEIGCSHPTEFSNTYALELARWSGVMVDNDAHAVALCRSKRKSVVINDDATKCDWGYLFGRVAETKLDYLSLDVDRATLDALRNLPVHRLRFNVITCEHDAYRFGDGPRNEMRRILKAEGYRLVAGNVCNNGQPYEDWWASEEFLAMAIRFESDGLDWQEIIKRA